MQYLGTVYLFLGVLPMVIASWFIQRCREERNGKETQKEKMLRPPGYSLRKNLEKLDERMWLAFMICMAAPGGIAATVLGRTKPDVIEAVCFGILIFILA